MHLAGDEPGIVFVCGRRPGTTDPPESSCGNRAPPATMDDYKSGRCVLQVWRTRPRCRGSIQRGDGLVLRDQRTCGPCVRPPRPRCIEPRRHHHHRPEHYRWTCSAGAFHTRTCRPWASGPALPTALDPPLGIRGGGDRRTTTRVGRHRERPRAVLRTRKEMPMSDATPEPQSEAMQSLATWNPIHGIWESPQLDLFGQRGPWSTTWWTCTMTRKAWPTRFRDRRTSPAVPSFHHARRRPGRGEPAGAAAYRPQRFNSPPLTPRVTTTNPSTLHHGTRQLDGPNRTAVHTDHRANHRSHGNGGGLS